MRHLVPMLLVLSLAAGCSEPAEAPTPAAPEPAPPPCEVYLFTWQDDDVWPVVSTLGNASQAPFIPTTFSHQQTGTHPAWVVFGFWRDYATGWQLQLDAEDQHTVSIFGASSEWTVVEDVPQDVLDVVDAWFPEADLWKERLVQEYEQNGTESRKGNRMASLPLAPGDVELGPYFGSIMPHEPWPPEHPWHWSEGAYILSTSSGNWSIRIPVLWIEAEHWRFYQDIWWNGGMEVRQDGTNITDAWEFLYGFAEDTGFGVPRNMESQGPRPCGSDPRSAY